MKTYIFMYFLVDDVQKIKNTIGPHVKYWKNEEFNYYRGGPFSDKTGGLIIFTSKSYEEATEIINNDPFIKGDTLKEYLLKEWIP